MSARFKHLWINIYDAALRDGERVSMTRPWEVYRTPELQERERDYVDFAAWEIWMEHVLDDDQFDERDTLEKIDIYGAMCDLCDDGCEDDVLEAYAAEYRSE